MKIQTRLLLGFSTLPFLILVLAGVGWYQISSIRENGERLQQNHQNLVLVGQIQRNVKDEALGLRNLFLLGDKTAIEQERISIRAKGQAVDQDLAQLEAGVRSEEQRRNIENLKAVNQTYKVYRDRVLELYAQGQQDSAVGLVNSSSLKLQERYFQAVDDLVDSSGNVLEGALTGLSDDFAHQLMWGTLLSLLGVIIGIGIVWKSVWTLARRLRSVSGVMARVAEGGEELSTRLTAETGDEIDDVARSFNAMAQALEEQIIREKQAKEENEEQAWLKTHLAEIMAGLSGIQELQAFSQTLLSRTAPLVGATQAVFYIAGADEPESEKRLKLLSSYAYKERNHLAQSIRFGEGLVGQAAFENSPILLSNIPPEYVRIGSGLGEAAPQHIYVLPVSFEDEVKAVVEFASLHPFDRAQQAFLDELTGNLGIMLDSILRRIRLAELLKQSQRMTEELQMQSEELQTQQEELRAANEELEEQTQALRKSEEKLQVQQEELEQTNAELREKADMLEMQNQALETSNRETEQARLQLEEKAGQLVLSSKYKSEFLANISHELRTPLNSLLILSKLLADNPGGNLTGKQVQFAETIHTSGSDLLHLINDILDLSKIESGKMGVNPGPVSIRKLAGDAEKQFRAVAQDKKLGFRVHCSEDVPEFVYSDVQRIQQVLKNLLSNAFKFTQRGEVSLAIGSFDSADDPNRTMVRFTVSDTGIGIPQEKQDLIFEAFHQADGTTSRKYGGTGLGLTICKEIASLLGGEITVESREGKGSAFSFVVGDYQAADNGYANVLHLNEAAAASEQTAAARQAPVPDLSSPVSAADLSIGRKSIRPVPDVEIQGIKRLLIVDDDLGQRNSLMELIGDRNVIMTAVSSAAEAKEELKVGQFDCMILDLGLSDASGFELLEQLRSHPAHESMAVLIYTGRDLTSKEEIQLKRYAQSIIIKDALSPKRLLEELELVLNPGGETDLTAGASANNGSMPHIAFLEGRKVLLVDDDVRNVFAISNVLEMHGMQITMAENGAEALKILEERSDIDLVLMDIMMPEMDGYEATRSIRAQPKYRDLPIIALTAKAMREDREKCIESGASDYIVKPVAPEQLVSLVSVWIRPEEE